MKQRNVYSVGQINTYIRNMFAQDFMMNHVAVRGEVSDCKYHSSGHIYFTLKDETGVLKAIMFRTQAARGLPFRMKEGDRVVVIGAIRIYERDGKYQLYAEEISREGAGLLYQKFMETKKELEEMGMFAEEYKQPIPRFVSRVGVVTAPTGAAVRDIQNISHRRNPYVQMILYPALVQGEYAAASIVQGIRALEAKNVDSSGYKFDVINIGRQVLGNLFSDFRDSFTACYRQKNIEGMKEWAEKMNTLFTDVDRLLSCESSFSIGKWIKDARVWGKNLKEKEYYEQNARCILTTWGQKATQLNDYANRGWGGLTDSYYRKRWELFTQYAIDEMSHGKEIDEKSFYNLITEFEYQWTLQTNVYSESSGEDPIRIANLLYIKYNPYFDK